MKKEVWKSHIEAFERSGDSRLAYANAHGLVYSQLLYWIRKLSSPKVGTKKKPKLDFVPVEVKCPEQSAQRLLGVLELPCGARLHIHDSRLLADLPHFLKAVA